ncbi:MAG TPA: tRNA lysidine(34) synthetase TilS [Bryobacteraceae bacterium]|nr:tRNA lysidine(34) synthetase TilS [Bryobacteraceae bacterium]
MLTRENRVIVAVSGGADSVCLLHALRELEMSLAGVAHFNHKLRGEESDADEHFVTAMASRMGIPFYRAEAHVGAAPGNLEQTARRVRREFLSGLMRDGAGDRVALGHTQDDQAETVLFRILRGSGLAGLAGVHPVTEDGFVRPLIQVTRADVLEFLNARGIEWREDRTNQEVRFARNRIRHGLLPELKRDWNPRLSQALAHLADLAYEEERWWGRNLPDLLTETGGGVEFPANELMNLDRSVARRLIRAAIARAKGDLRGIEFQHVERIVDIATGRRLRLPGIDVTRSFDWIRIAAPGTTPAVEPVEVMVPGSYATPDGTGQIQLEVDETASAACANLKVDLAARIELRAWRPGDHYRPVGKSRDRKLTEMFQSARVPSWRRRLWPILEGDGKILWAKEFGAAAGAPIRVSEILR